MTEGSIFLSGGTAMACVAIGLFFLRYWRRTGDRFFGVFALAFWVFAANRVVLVTLGDEQESVGILVYLFRLAAFLLIIAAVVDKNRGSARSR